MKKKIKNSRELTPTALEREDDHFRFREEKYIIMRLSGLED